MIKNVLTKFACVSFLAGVGPAVAGLFFLASAFAQLPAPAVPGTTPAPTAEVERVIVTG